MNSPKIQAILIFEVIGRPAEYLKQTLEDIENKLNQIKGIKIKSNKINEPLPYKYKEGFFTNFSEIEVEAENLTAFSKIMFVYIPSHIEIITPERLEIQNTNLNDFFNELAGKLHQYDEIARILQIEKIKLTKKVKELEEKEKKN